MTVAGPDDRWIVRLTAPARPRARLFCLPFAGGGTSPFRPLADAVPDEVEVCAVRLPGRESRRRELAETDLDRLVDALVVALEQYRDLSVALLGYCSGAFTAFELARALTSAGRPPVRLFVVSSPTFRMVDRGRMVHRMAHADFVAHLRDYRVTPESVLSDPAVLAVFEHGIRADFQAFELAEYRSEPVLDVPITVLAGRYDASVAYDELTAWRDETAGELTLRLYDGDHTFLSTAGAAIGRAIAADLVGPGPVRGLADRAGAVG
jgi:medium-chain acyl-[acyl-carrier-protein] hydrolase